MSFDLSGANSGCDHLQILERYVVDVQDFRTLNYYPNQTLNMRAPINAPSMMRLYFNGTLVNPNDPNYGYSVVPDPTRTQLQSYPFSKVMFKNPIRQTTPLVEVSYFTRPGFCLKCGGTGKTPDWIVSPSGSLSEVTGVKKLAQQALKYVLTSQNPFNRNLVCPVRSYVGQKFGFTVTDQDISSATIAALATYQSIQKAQSTVQTMSPLEMLQDVVSVDAVQDTTDPTKVSLSIVISPYGTNQTIPLNVALQTT